MPRLLTVAILAFVLTRSAIAEEEAWDRLLELEKSVDYRDPEAVAATLDSLTKQFDDLWARRLPPSPLRSALAARVNQAELTSLVLKAGEEDTARLAAIVDNFGSRQGITGILLDTGAWKHLPPTHTRLLTDLAIDALIEGDRRLAVALLSDSRTTLKMAGALSDLIWPAGLRLLADAVTNAVVIPAAARARLSTYDPNLSFYKARPLTPDRIAALVGTAGEDEDHAIRLLAARILLRSGSPDSFEAVLAAYANCRSLDMERWEWRRAGSWHHRRAFDKAISPAAKLSVLRGSVMFGQMFTKDSPAEAQQVALDFRRLYEDSPDPRFRGELLRELSMLHVHMVDDGPRRKHVPPGYLAFLRMLEAGRVDDPPALRTLGRRIGAALIADLGLEPGPRHRRKDVRLPRRDDDEDFDDTFYPDGDEFRFGTMDPEEEKALAERLRSAPDPFERWRAAQELAKSDSAWAFDVLLRSAERLRACDEGNGAKVPSAELHVNSLESLEVLLRFVEDASVSPHVRAAAFESLESYWTEWFERAEPALRGRLLRRVDAWVGERAPLLDSGLPEEILPTWASWMEEMEDRDEEDLAALGLIRPIGTGTVEAAIEKIPLPAARFRLRE